MGRNLNGVGRNQIVSGEDMSGLAAVLETLNAHYSFDAHGRILASPGGGPSPRFVLGRAAEGCLWRFGARLERAAIVRLARMAGREPGARFDGECPAPPDRLAALERLLPLVDDVDELDRATLPGFAPSRVRRVAVECDGIVVGELWPID
jgi:hypothetical protein